MAMESKRNQANCWEKFCKCSTNEKCKVKLYTSVFPRITSNDKLTKRADNNKNTHKFYFHTNIL